MADSKDIGGKDRPSKIHVTVIIQNRYTFDTDVVTGRQIKEKADIPAGFSLHRRVQGGNEPIHNDESVELHNGDHFLLASASNVPWSRRMSPRQSPRQRTVITSQGCVAG